MSNILTMDADGTDEVQLTTNGLATGAFDSRPDWQPIPGHNEATSRTGRRSKAEREFLGEAGFRQKYGGGANAYGKCVSNN